MIIESKFTLTCSVWKWNEDFDFWIRLPFKTPFRVKSCMPQGSTRFKCITMIEIFLTKMIKMIPRRGIIFHRDFSEAKPKLFLKFAAVCGVVYLTFLDLPFRRDLTIFYASFVFSFPLFFFPPLKVYTGVLAE